MTDYKNHNHKKCSPFFAQLSIWASTLFWMVVGITQFPLRISAQEPMQYRWDISDGLASNTVYCIYQDHAGYIWLGTNMGLCRFDGSSFKTFTTLDGLPDNEVLNVAEDYLHRLWITCFKSAPVYLYEDHIHAFPLKLSAITRDTTGYYPINMFLNQQKEFTIAYPEGFFLIDSSLHHTSFKKHVKASVTFYNSGKYLLQNGDSIYVFEGDKQRSVFGRNKSEIMAVRPIVNVGDQLLFAVLDSNWNTMFKIMDPERPFTTKLLYRTPQSVTTIISQNGSSCLALLNDHNEVRLYTHRQPAMDTLYRFNCELNNLLRDRSGNTWVSTRGEGLYMFPNQSFFVYNKSSGLRSNMAMSICGNGKDKLLVGFQDGNLDLIDIKEGNRIQHIKMKTTSEVVNSIRYRNDTFLLATNFSPQMLSLKGQPQFIFDRKTGNSKDIDFGDNEFVWANSACALVGKFPGNTQHITETRSTTVTRWYRGCYAVGTLQGVLIYKNNETVSLTGDSVLSQSRIIRLRAGTDSVLWIGTASSGLFYVYQNKIHRVSFHDWTSEPIIKSIFVDAENRCWMSANVGLCRISLNEDKNKAPHVVLLDGHQGFGINDINDVYVGGGKVFLATGLGVVTFKEEVLENLWKFKQPPSVYIQSFKANDSLYGINTPIVLKYDQNDIALEFVGISFSKPNSVRYKYLLIGGSRDTAYCTNGSLQLSSLMPGTYTFCVWSQNYGGEWNTTPAKVSFIIKEPWWTAGWFYLSVMLLLGTIIWWYFHRRLQKIKHAELVKRRVAELELQALRAQMNPHFIFNALNSIQGYYAMSDEISANRYIKTFATLIRQILDASRQPTTTVKEESQLLENYLKLEQMRMNHSLQFEVLVDKEVDSAQRLPGMLVQNYVENAVKHAFVGLPKQQERQIRVSFFNRHQMLIITVEDNGIGIHSSKNNLETADDAHRSAGMEITNQRIAISNSLNAGKIAVEIIDNKANGRAGTTVSITIPKNI
ncbi:MAG: histidine kinase [Chitinophagales bacterium]